MHTFLECNLSLDSLWICMPGSVLVHLWYHKLFGPARRNLLYSCTTTLQTQDVSLPLDSGCIGKLNQRWLKIGNWHIYLIEMLYSDFKHCEIFLLFVSFSLWYLFNASTRVWLSTSARIFLNQHMPTNKRRGDMYILSYWFFPLGLRLCADIGHCQWQGWHEDIKHKNVLKSGKVQ